MVGVMAIDSSIYNALGRGVKTVRDWEQEDEQRAGAAQSRELNALTLQGARETAADNALARRRTGQVQSSLMALGPNAKPDQVAGVYSQYGMTDQADKVLTSASTRAKSSSDVLNAGLQRGRELLQFVNTPQAAHRWWQAQYADPVVGPYLQQLGPLEEQFADIPTDPAQFGQWRQAASMLPDQFQTLIQKRQDAAREQQNKDRDFGLRSANELIIPGNGGPSVNRPLLDARKQVAQAGATVTMGSPVAGVDPATGQPVFFQPGNRPGVAPQILPGVAPPPKDKPTGEVSRAKDATEALQLIADAEKVIDQATGSYAGAGVDMLGQVVGVSTKGAQASAQLKAVEGMLVSKMPKMSGPQSDKDVALYRQMAGMIGDPTVPAKTKKAALQTIKQIQERYANGATAGPAPATAAPTSGATGGWSMQRVD